MNWLTHHWPISLAAASGLAIVILVCRRKCIAFFRYLPVKRKSFLKGGLRLFLHVFFLFASVTAVLLPAYWGIELKDLFVGYDYYFFHISDGSCTFNLPLITYVAILLASVIDYAGLNLLRFFEPKSENIDRMLGQVSENHLNTNLNSVVAVYAAEEICRSSTDSKKEASASGILCNSMLHSLDGISATVLNHMDSVGSKGLVTSNILVALDDTLFSDKRAWAPLKEKLSASSLYPEPLCSESDTRMWLKLITQCSRSRRELSLPDFTMQVHTVPRSAAPGAGSAVHEGLIFAENEITKLKYSVVNDVHMIEWPKDMPVKCRLFAKEHFKRHPKIKSFVSFPLVANKVVVGVLNVNSDDYFLGGLNDRQRATLDSIILPVLPGLARLVLSWRNINHGN